jgi:hypothetical protein
MKLARILSLLTGIVFACHFSAALAEPITDPAGSPVATGLETAVVDRGLSPTQNGVLIKASPSSATDEIAGTRTLTLTLPSGTDNGTLKIVLNGKNVTSRFSATSCNDGVCETATLTAADGLIDGKNVLYAIAKKSDSTLVSSRLRFEGGTTPTTQARSAIAHSSSAASVSARLWCKFSDGRRVAGDGVSDQAARTAFQSAGAAWSLKRRRLREN